MRWSRGDRLWRGLDGQLVALSGFLQLNGVSLRGCEQIQRFREIPLEWRRGAGEITRSPGVRQRLLGMAHGGWPIGCQGADSGKAIVIKRKSAAGIRICGQTLTDSHIDGEHLLVELAGAHEVTVALVRACDPKKRIRKVLLSLNVGRVGLEERLDQLQALLEVLEGLDGRVELKLSVAEPVVQEKKIAFVLSVVGIGMGQRLSQLQSFQILLLRLVGQVGAALVERRRASCTRWPGRV